jgi:hypothetical protein
VLKHWTLQEIEEVLRALYAQRDRDPDPDAALLDEIREFQAAGSVLALGDAKTLEIEQSRPGRRLVPFRYRKPRFTRNDAPPIVCGRCGTSTPEPAWRCAICDVPLCGSCADDLGHCGHTEAEIANRRGSGYGS